MNSRHHRIDDLDVFVSDDSYSEASSTEIQTLVDGLPYRKREVDFPGDEYPLFVSELSLDAFRNLWMCSLAEELVASFFPHETFTLVRAYVNLCVYGDMEYPHRDCGPDERDVTVVYYANQTWDQTWGGETLFFDRKGDTVLAVRPRPRRIAAFRGAIQHVGSVPTRICKAPRYTLALKFRASQKR